MYSRIINTRKPHIIQTSYKTKKGEEFPHPCRKRFAKTGKIMQRKEKQSVRGMVDHLHVVGLLCRVKYPLISYRRMFCVGEGKVFV